MAISVIMPKQGQSVETCIITKWLKNKNDIVLKGDILLTYETDKAAFDLESPGDGILLEKFFNNGDEVPVLVNVAVIGQPEESVSEFYPDNSSLISSILTDTKHKPNVKAEENPTKENLSEVPSTVKIRISPRARRIVKGKGLNFTTLRGTGPNGRIVASDIELAITSNAVLSLNKNHLGKEFIEQPLTNVRRLISKAMHSSLQESAQLTHHMSADISKLLNVRRKIKEGIASGVTKDDITLTELICWCVIKALVKFPDVNSHFLGESVRIFNNVHLGIAVDTPRGLLVPSIRNANEMNLTRLSAEFKRIADSCRKGNIDPELIKSTSATFTVSNLGNYGVEMFTPVINLPQTGILGICSIIYRPSFIENNTYAFIPFIGLSFTYDHRALDGGPATSFLKEIKILIENFNYL